LPAARRGCAARAGSDARSVERLLAWIDYRQDQRLEFQYPAGKRAAAAARSA
jgi:hypothetical protein